jgi:FdhE protein
VLALAARPFLSRPVELMQHRIDLEAWRRAYCPFCGGEPEMAVITPAADRRLICGRCAGIWPFAPHACPFCGNDERQRITSFTSRDGRYRLYGCDTCRRYVKAYDARTADRPVMLSVDSIATLPLDAAAIQKGYRA